MKKIAKCSIVVFCMLMHGSLSSQNFALDLDGVNDKIGVTNSASLNPTTALTVEAWINADVWKSSVYGGVIVGKQATSPDRGYCLTAGENGKAEFTVAIANIWISVASPAIMGLNSWYHIAGVFDGSVIKIYINGQLQATNTASGTISAATTTTMYLGENPTWSGRYFEGTIDEVRIWNTARSQSEIQSEMDNELTGNETGLVAYYNMNEGAGTSVGDATSNSNAGTMLNMDPFTDWVNGFVVSAADVGVTGIASPSVMGGPMTGSEKISVEIKNFATTPVSGFDVHYSLNGGAVVTETVSSTILPFESLIYTFSAPENMNGQSICTIKAYTSYAPDVNLVNDTVESVITRTLQFNIFDNVQHNFGSAGQTQNTTLYMPDSLTEYSQILIHVDLNCPGGGCDPWDQLGCVNMIKDNEKFELLRYITPFGVACGGWVFDVTDFRNYLTGKVNFESYIQVWGASGWLLLASLELVPGTPAYKYINVQKLWDKDNQVYGDPSVSYDLTDTLMMIPSNTEAAKIRLTTTGHGQGNTNNAAEFFDATHSIEVDGSAEFSQHLWNSNCGSNTCSPQSGTYTYSRAGWCPGQDVQPWFFNLSGLYTAGSTASFDYVLQTYTNLLNTGYNSGSHTEPYFRIKGYLVSYSNSLSTSLSEMMQNSDDLLVFPNPVCNVLNIESLSDLEGNFSIALIDELGVCCYATIAEFMDGDRKNTIDLSDIADGIYLLKITSDETVVIKKIIIRH
ncbi:MAG: hypothetical protein CVU11_13795 [Bacteroidetes bacterium HGW-Bacteroidetes-6]|jgi:hypothetical protein|nr:MAG: hypothetical protein CVU11_13795 [Bacteroidetes bacterium HGW-Bacteroidetes-6]